MAIKSLSVLQSDNILVYKAYKIAELREIAENNPEEIITMILKYKDGSTITSKDLKHELVSDVIGEANYNKWLDNAKKVVRKSNAVKFEKNTFVYNISTLSYDEEMLQKFNAENTFENRYNLYCEYRDYARDLNCEEAKEMYQYFVDIAKDKNKIDENTITSIMFIESTDSKDSSVPTVASIITSIIDHTKVYEALPNAQYKENYINVICDNIENYYDIIKKFLYTSQVKYHNLVIDKLIESDNKKVLEKTATFVLTIILLQSLNAS